MLRNEPNLGSKSKNNEFLARAPSVAEKPVVVENGQQLLSSRAALHTGLQQLYDVKGQFLDCEDSFRGVRLLPEFDERTTV